MPDKLKATYWPHPLRSERTECVVTQGTSLLDIVLDIDKSIVEDWAEPTIFLDGERISPHLWHSTIPKNNQVINVCMEPSGGDGGKNALRIISLLVVVVLSAVTYGLASGPLTAAYGATWGGAMAAGLAAGVGIAGSLAVNALIPPQTPSLSSPGAGGLAASPYLAISGVRNQANPYGPVPVNFGKNRIYPQLAGKPWVENYGQDTYLRMFFMVGKGQYNISDYKIGETDINNYEHQKHVWTSNQWTGSSDIYPSVVTETSLAIALTFAGGWQTQTTELETEEFICDITLPYGSWYFDNKDGEISVYSTLIEAQYSVTGLGNWIAVPNVGWLVLKHRGRYTISIGKSGLPSGQYDIRIRRLSADDAVDSNSESRLYWTVMRSLKYELPSSEENVTFISLRCKASEVLSGVIDQFNCVAERKLSQYDTDHWNGETVTRNPAWAFASILRDDPNKRPVSDSRIDLTGLEAWAGRCAAAGRNFDGVVDYKGTVFETLKLIAAAGRASLGMKDGKISVVEDEVQVTPIQHFSPRNSWGFKGAKAYQDLPHAFDCRFVDEENEYMQNEIRVFDDGYFTDAPTSASWVLNTVYGLDTYVTPTVGNTQRYYRCVDAGTSAATEPVWPRDPQDTIVDGTATWMCYMEATLFEHMDFFGVTNSAQIWKLARYHIAVARLRPETYTINTDVEHLRCTRGDLVRLTHDVLLVGLGVARIKAIVGNVVTIDDSIIMEAGKTYAAQVRKADGTMLDTVITLDVGEQTDITLASVAGLAEGDMIFFGETGLESIECLLNRVEPGDDLTARLTLVPYNAGIYTADSTTIPTYDTGIIWPGDVNKIPNTPTINGIIIDQLTTTIADDDDIQITAILGFSVKIGTEIPISYLQCRYHIVGDDWTYTQQLAKNLREVHIPVLDGATYDFQIRSVSEFGATSAWATESGYTVSFTNQTPDDITGLALVDGGTYFNAPSAEIKWTAPTDSYRVSKVKIDVYDRAPIELT